MSAQRSALLLMGLLAASCDVFYGVTRRAEAPSGFDPAKAQELLRAQPAFDADGAVAWDGRFLWCPFRCADAITGFAYRPLEEHGGGGIAVEPLWVGRPPDADVLRRSMELQDEVLRVLATQQGFPAMSRFTTERVNMKGPR